MIGAGKPLLTDPANMLPGLYILADLIRHGMSYVAETYWKLIEVRPARLDVLVKRLIYKLRES